MDPSCLAYSLTDEERKLFDEQGYFIVKNVLPDDMVASLNRIVDGIDEENRPKEGSGAYSVLNHFDIIGRDDLLLELLDWPKTFPKVWGILGWHIQLYHSHLIVSPPWPDGQKPRKRRLGWHQDSGRLNIDLETRPRPRISLKVAYFVSDCTATDRGNFHAIPGSHRRAEIEFPDNGELDPEGAVPIRAAAGDAVFFDRRLWHASGINYSEFTRKVLFYGYSYRWLRPRDNMTVDHYMDRCDPIRRQLLGAGPSGGHGFTSPKPEDIPLREWIGKHAGSEFVIS